MAIKIGTNFSYQGLDFLDNRQGIADTLNDLLGWDILVPEGFEVCVNGEWYVYDSSFNSSITGHFKRRPRYEDFKELDEEVFPLLFSSFPQSSTYEVGTEITPTFSWAIERKGRPVIPADSTVNDSAVGIGSNNLSYEAPEPITTTTSYTVKSISDSGMEISGTVSYKFYPKKYWGVSEKTTLLQSDILSMSSTFATSWTLSATVFNCSGGKYPYYIIPSSLYNPSTFRMWISGLRNTDLVVSTMDITNALGVTLGYTIIRLGTLQNGSPVISFSN